MAISPTLVELCQRRMVELANRDAAKRKELFLLPSDLLSGIVPLLCPLALESLQNEADCKLLFVENCGESHSKQHSNAKRSFDAMMGGCSLCCLNGAWKKQFDERWPFGFKNRRFDTLLSSTEVMLLNLHEDEASIDWRQRFWEAHVQECLNEAVAQVSTSHHRGPLCDMTLSNHLSEVIGCCDYGNSGTKNPVTGCLKYICWQFGNYVRYLRLRGAVCTKELSIVLSCCTDLQHVVCSHVDTKIQVEGLCLLFRQIRGRLHVLELQHCNFFDYGLLEIRDSLMVDGEDHCLLQHLFVHSSKAFFNRSSQGSVFRLFLQACRSLQSLVLVDNEGRLVTAYMLFQAIADGKLHLSLLHVRENELRGLSQVKVSGCCDLSSLKALDFRSNSITSEDMKDFLSLYILPRLELLNLSDNPIGDEGLIALLPVLQGLQLSELSLSACHLSMRGVCSFLDFMITSGHSLQSLCLSHNGLGSAMGTKIGDFLRHGLVERLDIGDIGLGTDGCLVLESSLIEIPKLTHCILRKNRLGSAVAALFSKLLAMPNSLLKVIDLSSNLLDRQCLQSMALELVRMQGGMLELVDLRNNPTEDLRVFENIKTPQVLLSEVAVLHDDDP